MLQLQGVSVFQDKVLVLSDINLSVAKGDFLYLIGKTGSGKSSLMKTFYADLPLTHGEGSIVGYDLNGLKEKQIPFLRRKLGIIFQDFKLLLDRSIFDNLAFVLKATGWKDKDKIKRKIKDVLKKVEMQEMAYKMPFEISGGEQQRIAIARALLNDPDLILADEPTGNLDPKTSVEIMQVLQDINKSGKTVIMATHDYALILKFPNKTLRCEEGKVYEVVQKSV